MSAEPQNQRRKPAVHPELVEGCAVLLAAALSLSACSGLYTSYDGGIPGDDGGSGGGQGGAGGSGGGGTGGTGGSGGVGGGSGGTGGSGGSGGSGGGSGGSGGSGGGSGGGGGGLPPYYVGNGNALSFNQVTHPNLKIYTSVHGRPGIEVYVGGAEGNIIRCTVGTPAVCTSVFADVTLGPVTSVWVDPAGRVFAADDEGFISCSSNCTASASYSAHTTANHLPKAVCGAPDGTPYGIAVDLNSGGADTSVWRFNSGWSRVATIAGTGQAYSCAVVGNALLVGATGDVGRWTAPSGPTAIEKVDYTLLGTSGSSTRWFGINAAVGVTSIVGDDKWIAERQPDAGWTVVFHPTLSTGPHRAIAGRFDVEQYAAGDLITAGTQATRRTDGGWAFISDLGNLEVYGLWAEDDNTYWMVGQSNPGGTGTGVIYRAKR